MREWLVIESSMKRAVFADDELRNRRGYIPRNVAEELLGRSMDGTQWFTIEDSAKMRAHPEWSDAEPIGGPPRTEDQSGEQATTKGLP